MAAMLASGSSTRSDRGSTARTLPSRTLCMTRAVLQAIHKLVNEQNIDLPCHICNASLAEWAARGELAPTRDAV